MRALFFMRLKVYLVSSGLLCSIGLASQFMTSINLLFVPSIISTVSCTAQRSLIFSHMYMHLRPLTPPEIVQRNSANHKRQRRAGQVDPDVVAFDARRAPHVLRPH